MNILKYKSDVKTHITFIKKRISRHVFSPIFLNQNLRLFLSLLFILIFHSCLRRLENIMFCHNLFKYQVLHFYRFRKFAGSNIQTSLFCMFLTIRLSLNTNYKSSGCYYNLLS